MAETVASRNVIVRNSQGLHARPADLFTRLASRFDATIEVIKDGKRVDGKSILEILTLAAAQGTLLTIVARGDDAEQAVEALGHLIEQENPLEQMADETQNDQIGSA